MIYLYTGNGKGKTTAALGAALRATGYGWKVCILQFMKGTWTTGEIEALNSLAKAGLPDIELIRMGKGFYKILDDKFTEEEHRAAAREALNLLRKKISSGIYQLIILDEINVAADLKLLDPKEVLALIKPGAEATITPDSARSNSSSPLPHFILTGRDAPQSFIAAADLVTEMREIKHPFQKGVHAVKGLDF